ncbi:MAG: CheB methylesterase domain-containing protein, partial [Methylocystaceae bacterium]
QHMPPGFTRSLAERLDQMSALKVKEAENGEEIVPGTVYIAPGDQHLLFQSRQEAGRKRLYVELSKNNPVNGHRPAVDPMFFSMADKFWSNQMVAVIMTGMGSDGAQGLAYIKERGGQTIAEDQSSCVVFGMPKAAIATGKVDKVVPLSGIAQEITRLL